MGCTPAGSRRNVRALPGPGLGHRGPRKTGWRRGLPGWWGPGRGAGRGIGAGGHSGPRPVCTLSLGPTAPPGGVTTSCSFSPQSSGRARVSSPQYKCWFGAHPPWPVPSAVLGGCGGHWDWRARRAGIRLTGQLVVPCDISSPPQSPPPPHPSGAPSYEGAVLPETPLEIPGLRTSLPEVTV